MADIGPVTTITPSTEEEDNVVDVVATIGDPDTMEGHQGTPAGIDSRPMPGDYAVGVQLPGSGEWAIIGYIDPKNASVAENGEIRLYSRDSQGAPSGTLHLNSDGEAVFHEGVDFAVAHTDLSTALTQFASKISVELGKIATAINAIVPGSYTPTPPTVDISGAKVDTVKLP